MDYKRLFHDEKSFRRETLEMRMRDFGFKNMGRMELFLWDLELFLQIQDRLGEGKKSSKDILGSCDP